MTTAVETPPPGPAPSAGSAHEEHPPEASSPCMQKLDRLPWVAHRTLEIGNDTFGVRTTSTGFADWLGRAIPAYVRDEDSPPYYSVFVPAADSRRSPASRRFSVFYRTTNVALRTADPATLRNAFVEEMETFVAGVRADAIYVTAALVVLDDIPVLVTRTAMSLIENAQVRFRREGARFTTSRWLAIDSTDLVVVPRPLTIEVDPRAVPKPTDRGSADGSDSRMVVDGPTPIRAVFGLGSAGPLIRRMSPATGLLHLTGHLMNLSVLGGEAIIGLGEIAQRVPSFRLRSDSPAATADALFETIRSL